MVFNKFKVLGKGFKAHDRVSAKENIRSQSRQIEKYCPFEWLKIVRDLTLVAKPTVTKRYRAKNIVSSTEEKYH
ncbi:hypothetical protein [Shewanella baltica]|uniref:hypothetical protein n=1 Tax=Shewanella baltica TaxID=62322 RepID=UPI00217EC849|nr:hypothetical protein [Shewanella baltica]MCS6123151.1 hypothetical protein [Shewanella baltica]